MPFTIKKKTAKVKRKKHTASKSRDINTPPITSCFTVNSRDTSKSITSP